MKNIVSFSQFQERSLEPIEEKTIDFIVAKPTTDKKKTAIKELDKLWQKANEE